MLGRSGRSTAGIKAPLLDGTQVCAQVDPEIFFPDDSENPRLTLNTARKLCASCEFKEPCLEYAIVHPELVGVWAGTNEWQREDIRTARNKRVA